ncbi:MAG: hypothetical protein JWQ96_2788 [Segetibacter sp.]|nr:hypothetical protein [Segetibacter sp.]
MKKVLILLLLVSCASPKSKIVDRQKEIDKQLAVLKTKVEVHKSDAVKLIRASNNNLSKPATQSKYMGLQDSIYQMEQRRMSLQTEQDSLTLVLTKLE